MSLASAPGADRVSASPKQETDPGSGEKGAKYVPRCEVSSLTAALGARGKVPRKVSDRMNRVCLREKTWGLAVGRRVFKCRGRGFHWGQERRQQGGPRSAGGQPSAAASGARESRLPLLT